MIKIRYEFFINWYLNKDTLIALKSIEKSKFYKKRPGAIDYLINVFEEEQRRLDNIDKGMIINTKDKIMDILSENGVYFGIVETIADEIIEMINYE